jgi:proteasome accessory factor A
MNRVAGIETEYGCLVHREVPDRSLLESWPHRIKNHIFKARKLGVLDIHYRDYEEPPGNGGFLLNGGRVYVDMGHLEYCTPECLTVADAVAYDIAGDRMVWESVRDLGAAEDVAFYKNNIDHFTGATFGCHENYLTRRDTAFHERSIGVMLSFLATRQIFTGAGRVGMTIPLGFEAELTPAGLNLIDGRYAAFGYVVDGFDVLQELSADDGIVKATVLEGAENLRPHG